MTQLILNTSKHAQVEVQRKATDKESLTVQTECTPATSDQFRGVTKMIALGNDRRAAA